MCWVAANRGQLSILFFIFILFNAHIIIFHHSQNDCGCLFVLFSWHSIKWKWNIDAFCLANYLSRNWKERCEPRKKKTKKKNQKFMLKQYHFTLHSIPFIVDFSYFFFSSSLFFFSLSLHFGSQKVIIITIACKRKMISSW